MFYNHKAWTVVTAANHRSILPLEIIIIICYSFYSNSLHRNAHKIVAKNFW